jgi:hypothetical protein
MAGDDLPECLKNLRIELPAGVFFDVGENAARPRPGRYGLSDMRAS